MQSDGCNQEETPYIPQTSFEIRQRAYFADLLKCKWECDSPGHTVCVPTEDNQHYPVSEENFKTWVNALCLGEATTSQPPDGLLWPKSSVDKPSASVVRAVSIPPSHRRNVRSSMLVATASIRDSLSSRPSSGAPGPGYYSGKAIGWFGQKCINGIEDVIIFKRCWQYKYRLKQLSSSKGDAAGRNFDKELFAMLEDILELSRDCYSDPVKLRALDIAYRADKLAMGASSKEAFTWRLNCMVCFAPLDLAYHHRSYSSSDLDFIHNLRDFLTKVPLALQDTQAATSVIRILASELIYSTHEIWVTWRQGHMLCNVLSEVKLLRDLTVEEIRVIYSLAMRRLERHTQTSRIFCRPWEVAIVGLGSMADPWLEDFVRGPCGIPSLVLVLDLWFEMDMYSFPKDLPKGYPTAISDVLEALQWLSRCGWIAEIATAHVVAHIVTVLVRHIWQPRDCYNCLRILHHIFAYRPALLQEFVQLGGGAALLGTLSFIRRQPHPDWEFDKDIKNQSIEHLNNILRRIEQVSSRQ